ncbi:MAG: hemolysin III family protein [Bacillales bacterium]|jgi:hemolysin III|nr:hemolysin III family protein [Bacillales bacterium]
MENKKVTSESTVINNTQEKDFRKAKQTLGEEIGNSITHGVGCIMGIVMTILMLLKCQTSIEYVSISIFGFAMFFLYLNSCLYHAWKNGSTVKKVYKRFDHLSIYVLIAGTYTPILLITIGGITGWIFFAVQWFLVILGIIAKSIYPNKFQIVHLILFALIGWSGAVFVIQLPLTLMLLILAGGIAYTVGILFYSVFMFKWHHFIWHFFVLAGTILHVIAIFLFVL